MQGSNVRRDPAITVFQEPTTQTDLQLKIAVSVIVVNLKREAAFFIAHSAASSLHQTQSVVTEFVAACGRAKKL